MMKCSFLWLGWMFLVLGSLLMGAGELSAKESGLTTGREELFIHRLIGGDDLVTAFKKQPKMVEGWDVVIKHADEVRLNPEFLTNLSKHLDEFPALKSDLVDHDVFTAYKKIADDLEQSYEILDDLDGNLSVIVAQKVNTSSASNFWKWIKNGKKFEKDLLLPALKNRMSKEYRELKKMVTSKFGVNLDDFDMYSQVQLKYNGSDFFVADQVYVKWVDVNGVKVIDDFIAIENKLNSTTKLTTNQNAAKAATSLEVRSLDKFPDSSVSGLKLEGSILTNNKWLKMFDSANGDKLSGIEKL